MRVNLRLAVSELSEDEVRVVCVNLKEAQVESENIGEALTEMQKVISEKVQAYTQAGKRVPWERPRKRTPLGEDGSNQTLWVDLELEEDNLPPGNVIVTCISCGAKLHCEDHNDDNVPTVVYDGIICQSHGNYGSTQFDLEDGELVLYLCDDCLVKKAEIVRHVRWKRQPKIANKVQSFRELRKK